MMERLRRLNDQVNHRVPNSARLVAPILLGAALIAIIASTLWYGGKRESLAAYAEGSLLRFALKHSIEPAQSPQKIVVISAKDTDMPSMRPAPHPIIRDVHIEEYATIIERVAAQDPSMIVVSWLGSAHPMTVEYLRPLTDTIDRLGIADKTIIAVHLYITGAVPEELSRKYQIAEARDCYYEVNVFCTWKPDWTWMPQRVASKFFVNPPPWHISTNLPHVLPNFILNLPAINSIPSYSFLDFRLPVTAEIAKGAAVFIGNDTTQDLQFRNNKDLLQRTFVAASPDRRTLQADGVPFHVFWAAMGQMFVDQHTVAVVPEIICGFILVLMCTAILAAIRYLGGMALGPFLICAISLPFVNLLGVRYWLVYMPVMPMIVAGFAIFIGSVFISVAYNSYKKWRLQAIEQKAESTSDIKQNFISLISHNLNTPVAQLRGLLDMLQSPRRNPQLSEAISLLEYVRVIVRVVLNTSALANTQGSSPTHVTTRQLWSSFLENEGNLIARIGVQCHVSPDPDDEDLGEIWFYRFHLDQSIAHATLLNAIGYARSKFQANNIEVHFAAVHPEPGNPKGLVIRLQWTSATQSSAANAMPREFVHQALMRYMEAVAASREVQFIFETNAVTITFKDLTPIQ